MDTSTEQASMTAQQASLPAQPLDLMGSVFAASREGIMVVDAGGFIIDVNPSFERITGYCKEEVIGRTPRVLSSGRHDPAFYAAMWAAIAAQGEWRGEIVNRRKSGALYAELLQIHRIAGADGLTSHYVASFLDLESLDVPAASFEQLIHRDCLTGLPNARTFALQAEAALRRAAEDRQPMALCVLAVEALDEYRTMLGAPAVDEMVCALARRLERVVLADALLAYDGHGGFWLICPYDAPPSFARRTRQWQELVAAPLEVQDLPLAMSARIGVAVTGRDGDTFDQLQAAAQQGLEAPSS